MKKKNKFPPGWNEERVQKLILHYEQQTEEEAVAEDEAAFERKDQAVMVVPQKLVPAIRKLIAKHQASTGAA
jgi:hypothetical protein